MITGAIYSELSTTSAITAFSGSRIYPAMLPQNPTIPAITYHIDGGETDHTFDGSSDLSAAFVQFDCWHTSANLADVFGTSVMQHLKHAAGKMWGSHYIFSIIIDNYLLTYDETVQQYRASVSVTINYRN